MNAIAPNQLSQSQLKPPSLLNDWVSVSKPWTRKKKKNAMARPSVVVISAKRKMVMKTLRIACAIELIARPTSTMTIATMMIVSLDASPIPMPGSRKLAAA